jgi:NADPH-dependent 2,4-dienoyl-CoA reductase/sulfur reductase-like enzyme
VSTHRLVVVGGSLAGLRAAETARKLGFAGTITMISAEPGLPYDRPPLSKAYLTSDDRDTTFRDADALRGLEIDLHAGVRATALDVAARTVHTDAGAFGYDGLVVATGVSARRPPIPGDLDGVHTLRTAADAAAIRAAFIAGARVLVVGAGFIGSEVASSARARGLDVTIVEHLDTPLVRSIGSELGAALSTLHTGQGTGLRCGTKVISLEGNGKVERARLSDGSVLDVDLVVFGVGAAPNTGWLASSGLTLDDGVVCDEYLSAAPGVYAAGDVARWPNALFGEAPMRLEHWTNATEQAAAAVRHWLMPDAARPHESVPYFWSDWYDSRIQFTGSPAADEVRVVSGSPAARKFVALYRRGDRVIGALTLNRPSLIMKLRALVARRASWADAVGFATGR